jgi:ABC-type cobalamin/Fe3+-siderophores transport system ATPase subunit
MREFYEKLVQYSMFSRDAPASELQTHRTVEIKTTLVKLSSSKNLTICNVYHFMLMEMKLSYSP